MPVLQPTLGRGCCCATVSHKGKLFPLSQIGLQQFQWFCITSGGSTESARCRKSKASVLFGNWSPQLPGPSSITYSVLAPGPPFTCPPPPWNTCSHLFPTFSDLHISWALAWFAPTKTQMCFTTDSQPSQASARDLGLCCESQKNVVKYCLVDIAACSLIIP